MKNGIAFPGVPITNNTGYTAQQPLFTDLGLAGTELKSRIAKHNPAKATYIRARAKYSLATAITGQVYGPWRYPEGFLRGRRDVGSVALPVKFISFIAMKQNENVLLKWITTDETTGTQYEVEHGTDGIHFARLKTLPALNRSQQEYTWLHIHPAIGNNFYRIRAVENNKEAFSPTRKLIFDINDRLLIYPNPVLVNNDLLIKNENIDLGQPVRIALYNNAGQKLWEKTIFTNVENELRVSIPALPAGVYPLILQTDNWAGKGKITVTGSY